jgi:hypothetical protein
LFVNYACFIAVTNAPPGIKSVNTGIVPLESIHS